MTDTVLRFPWSEPLEGLPLRAPTPAGWADLAVRRLDELLVDHAHCEQKAASMAVALIGRFPAHPGLARDMLALAHEEMQHFRQVLDRIEARGGRLTKPGPDTYVRELREWSFHHRGGLGALGDLLLLSAFVEARSAERFRLLAERLGKETAPDLLDLGAFYVRLADAESRHWERFRDLALTADRDESVEARLAEMAAAEAAILIRRPLEPRMH